MVSKNFSLGEFIHPLIFEWYGEKSIWFIDHRIITMAQFFRDRYEKPININGKYAGQTFTESGLRRFNTSTGAQMSQHKFGRAIDMRWYGMDTDEVREDIKNNKGLLMEAGVRAVENNTQTWIHLDCRNINDLIFI